MHTAWPASASTHPLHSPAPLHGAWTARLQVSGPSTQPSSSSCHLPHRSPGKLHVLPLPASPSCSLPGSVASPYLTFLEVVLAISKPSFLVSQMQKGEAPAEVTQPQPKHRCKDSYPLSTPVSPNQPPLLSQHLCSGLYSKASP